jgi:hypothetical protein
MTILEVVNRDEVLSALQAQLDEFLGPDTSEALKLGLLTLERNVAAAMNILAELGYTVAKQVEDKDDDKVRLAGSVLTAWKAASVAERNQVRQTRPELGRALDRLESGEDL